MTALETLAPRPGFSNDTQQAGEESRCLVPSKESQVEQCNRSTGGERGWWEETYSSPQENIPDREKSVQK